MEKYNFEEKVKNKLVNAINDGYLVGKDVCEIHNEVYNSDYFVSGYHRAEEYLIQHEGIFNAIREITEYETNNFGERLLHSLDCLGNFQGEVTEELLQDMLYELEN